LAISPGSRCHEPRFLAASHPEGEAEVYWDLEQRLLDQGFDYAYDKPLYDHLVQQHYAAPQRHLLKAGSDRIARSVHFIENHDEQRAANTMSVAVHRAAALTILGLPGMRLIQHGQLTGARRYQPIQLARHAVELPDAALTPLYRQLLETLSNTPVGFGHAQVIAPLPAWPDNQTHQNYIIVQWQSEPPDFCILVVNLAPHRGQCYAPLNVPHLAERDWRMKNLLGEEKWVRYGEDLARQGLYLDVPPHAAQLFHLTPN
jgi:hypothetical protein